MKQFTKNDELTGLAGCDELTLSFNNLVKTSVKRCGNFSLLVLSLNDFKEINSEYGLDSGDLVLTSVARMLLNCIHYSDQVFRCDQDKFTIILNNTDKPSVIHLIEHINRGLINNSLLAEFNVSCTIGWANYHDSDNLNSLFERAEQALYLA